MAIGSRNHDPKVICERSVSNRGPASPAPPPTWERWLKKTFIPAMIRTFNCLHKIWMWIIAAAAPCQPEILLLSGRVSLLGCGVPRAFLGGLHLSPTSAIQKIRPWERFSLGTPSLQDVWDWSYSL
ncbi:uncharacterized protein LOC143286490 [Babylonia areolata]|uniref:uncharacterized protein LOC143286490 n=1 Tax=Babylonia areolata TaxID=304850 RepID=UPI003FD1C1C6